MKSTHIHIKEIKEKHYIGHRSRLRDRFNKFGPEALQEYELVELLLTTIFQHNTLYYYGILFWSLRLPLTKV